MKKMKIIPKKEVIKNCIYCKSEIKSIDEPYPYCGFWIGQGLDVDKIDT